MTANIAPNSANFQGSIYVKGHAGQSACTFAASPNSATPGYVITLMLNSGVNNPCAGPNSLVQNGASWTYTVIVQHSPNGILTYTDEEHRLTCSGGTGEATVSVGPVNPTGGSIGGTDVAGPSTQAFRLQVTTVPNRVAPAGPIAIGQALYLQATPINTGNVPDFRMTACTAAGINGGQLVMLVNRCITPQGRESGVTALSKVGNTMISLEFKAFKFNNADIVRISCQFQMCASVSDPACQLSACAGNSLNYGRRKREAESSNQTQPESTISLYVVSSLEEFEGRLGKSCPANTDEVCFHFATVAGVASLFLFLLVIVLVMLAFVVVRLRTKRSKEGLTTYTNNYDNHQNM
ncbi:uncharacterized protein LOC135470429 [Liolophura sinensis]|uniref:uncharacterized protein LOC135470429 n=1 Tax=Liolophura sinensis TaxID=3198878 RepID=UPI0031580946